METIISFDWRLFELFNSQLTCGFLDWLMPFITNAKTWMPIIILVWLGLILSGSKKFRVLALLLLVGVGANDLICARVLKKGVGRTRPCSVEPGQGLKCRLLLPKKGSKSFPSNHASNTAAFAAVIVFYLGFKAGLPFLILSLIVGYSRVYVGVHFPFDVMAGWLIGLSIGWGAVFHAKILFPQMFEPQDLSLEKEIEGAEKEVTKG